MKDIVRLVEDKMGPVMISLLLVALCSLVSVQGQSLRTNDAQSSSADIPTVTLCDLYSKPDDYNGKEVRVRARYHIGFEHSYFGDTSCKVFAVKTTPFWIGNIVWADFDESIKASTKPEVYKQFKEAASVCCPDGWRDTQVDLVITGRFCKAEEKDSGYGHGGIHALKIVVNKIEEVTRPVVNPAEGNNQPRNK